MNWKGIVNTVVTAAISGFIPALVDSAQHGKINWGTAGIGSLINVANLFRQSPNGQVPTDKV